MSCPYLEKGRIARCHAFAGIGLKLPEGDVDCYSGEFTDCPLLFSRSLRGRGYPGRRKIPGELPRRNAPAGL